ncbi:MAG: hypothetical protein AAB427_00385, partial [Chloroflexota bacterium]
MLRLPNRILAGGHFRVAFLLLLLTSVGLTLYTPWLGFVGDDWWFFAHLSDGNFLSAQFYENPARPGVVYLWLGLWQAFGFHLWAYYVVSFVAQWLASYVLFVLLHDVFCWPTARAAATAALFLLYPADTAHPYLSTLSTRLCVLAAMSGATLWLYSHTRSTRPRPLLALSAALMGAALLTYETPMFLFMLLPFALVLVVWRGIRVWLQQAFTCYVVLAAYLAFRIVVAYQVAQRATRFYVSLNYSVSWLMMQFSALLGAVTWKGWLYSLKAMFDFGLLPSSAMLIAAMAVILLWLARLRGSVSMYGLRESALLIAAGLALSLAGAIPVMVSSVPLNNAVGTLDGRLIHATALGHAIGLIGLCELLATLLTRRQQMQNLFWSTAVATMLSLAMIGNMGVQRDYARSWQTQLSILRGLQSYAESLRDNTTIVLLETPSGPFNIRFYYSFTEMIRRFYAAPTLQALPWSKGFPPDEQTMAFGEDDAIVLTDTVQRKFEYFDYNQIAAFKVNETDGLDSVTEIDNQYFVASSREARYLSLPPGWRPASGSIRLGDP